MSTQDKKNEPIAILQSCLAWAISPSGEKFKVGAFFDGGSEISLITRNVSKRMGLSGKDTTLSLNVAGGGTTEETKEKEVSFHLQKKRMEST